MLPWVVNYRPHLPRTSHGPRSNELCRFPFTSLTTCNSFTLNSFADPHPLNPNASILYKNIGGGRQLSWLPTFNVQIFQRFPPPVFRTLFQVRYPATPLFVALTKTAGVCTNNS